MIVKKNGPLGILLILIILIGFFASGCDKYQSESYEISTIDAEACAQIQDTLYNSVSAVKLTDFDSTWTHDNVQQNVPAIIDSLKANGIVVSEDDLSTWITTVAVEDTNYVCFSTNLTSVTFYSDQIIKFQLLDTDGEINRVTSLAMPLETVGGCINDDGNPIVKTRLEYASPDDDYLLYIINQEQTIGKTIILSILKR